MENVTSRFLDFLYEVYTKKGKHLRKIRVPMSLYQHLNQEYQLRSVIYNTQLPKNIEYIYLPFSIGGFVKIEIK